MKIDVNELKEHQKDALLMNFEHKSNASLEVHRELVATLRSGDAERIGKAFARWCYIINAIEETSFQEIKRICAIETDEPPPTLQ